MRLSSLLILITRLPSSSPSAKRRSLSPALSSSSKTLPSFELLIKTDFFFQKIKLNPLPSPKNQTEEECDACRVDDAYDEKEIEFDRDSFSRLLKRRHWQKLSLGAATDQCSGQRIRHVFNSLVVNDTCDDLEAEFLKSNYILPKESCFYMVCYAIFFFNFFL